ncbi:TerB family tellurite resistance protein [Chryseolinea soli]|nr:TerB family tellurite resistance protein [Chryseolinea soli]
MSALAQMKLLISLAQIDGTVADRERNYIINIGRANNVYPDEVKPLFDKRHDLIVPEDLSDDRKFDYLFSLVQLMKIDERMYKEEIMFCSKIASNLGYDQQVMFELLLHVKAGAMGTDEMSGLKSLVQKYLHH